MSFDDSIEMPKKAQSAEGIFITYEQAKAVNVLIAAAQVAQKSGAFSLNDAAAVFDATQAFRVEQPQSEEVVDEETQVEEKAS